MKKLFCSVFVSFSLLFSAQKNDVPTSKMEWFQDAKLGIFIHWGIYSVKGISESWAFF
ncbi:alpha-L-fucosidase [Soonwooa sp.]|uniref:alpha-L-fucosidase n=1 Tax=Soonwooa sp. TaxID=1938592 RepID=UPI0028A5D2AC|nr:alpha-L-fucosidase [Soonwooa sp.]